MNMLRYNIILSFVLRSGLFISILLISMGMWFSFLDGGFQIVDYSVFKGEPEVLKTLSGILEEALQLHSGGLIQLGILSMIATPVFRVVSCLGIFIYQRDYVYVGISGGVLTMLLYSLFYGWK